MMKKETMEKKARYVCYVCYCGQIVRISVPGGAAPCEYQDSVFEIPCPRCGARMKPDVGDDK